MEEAEVPLEHVHEEIHHSAEHSGENWISWVALSTAILAVLAAIAGLLSGKHANEAMMSQIEASDQWGYYQAKSIKASVLDAKIALSSAPSESDAAKRDRYEKEQEEIKTEAEHKQAEAKSNFHQHEVFARGVTMFQIAIAIAAISALTKKRHFWIVARSNRSFMSRVTKRRYCSVPRGARPFLPLPKTAFPFLSTRRHELNKRPLVAAAREKIRSLSWFARFLV